MQRIGKYAVEQPLGSGSFATVWLAVDEVLDARVAIKVLADNWARNAGVRARFIDEAKILRRIDDDHIVRVHVVDELEDGRPYFVMSWADRGTLLDRVRDTMSTGSHFTIDTAVALSLAVCECVAVVHDYGIIHRDLKPSNILFRSVRRSRVERRDPARLGDEQLLLADFGLAKDLAAGSGFTVAAGTPAYMAPEQARASEHLDERADVFAIAAITYELLAGRPAFSADSLSGVGRAHVNGRPVPLHHIRPDVSAGFQAVIDRGLSPDPANRYAGAPEFAEALRDVWIDAAGRVTESIPIVHARSSLASDTSAEARPDVVATVLQLIEQAEAMIDPDLRRTLLGPVRDRLLDDVRVAVIGPVDRAAQLGWHLAGAEPTVSTMQALRHVVTWIRHDAVGDERAVVHLADGSEGERPVGRDAQGAVEFDLAIDAASVERVVFHLAGIRPGRPTVVIPAEAADLQAVICEVDAALVLLREPGDDDRRARVRAALATTPTAPALMLGLIDPSGFVEGGASVLAGTPWLAAVYPDDGELTEVEAHLGLIVERRAELVRASAALTALEAAIAAIPDRKVARRVRAEAGDLVEQLRLDVPPLGDLNVLRAETAGRVPLPSPWLGELRRVLLGGEATARLGLDPSASTAEQQAAAQEATERWRAFISSGRAPFQSRGAAETVARCYDRLWAAARDG